MKKRKISLSLSIALCLALCACAPNRAEPTPGPSLNPPPPEASVPVLATPEPEPSPDPPAPPLEDYDLPERDYRPWQVGYMDFLSQLCRLDMGCPWDYAVDDVDDIYKGLAVDGRRVYSQTSGDQQPLTHIMGMGSDSYSLHDVDRDGMPELFVEYGWYGVTQCYAFRDGQVVCIGEFDTKDSSLYTHPDKNAILRAGGRMGYYQLYEYPMEGGVLTEEREIFSEGPVDLPTGAAEIVPGARRIDRFWIYQGERDDNKFRTPESEGLDDGRPHPSAGKALLLPICDWGVGPAATGDSSETARTAILAALDGKSELYGASGDHFYGDTGPVTWGEYIQPHGACPYNDEPLEVKAHSWLDLNGDGQEECVLQVGEPERTDDPASQSRSTVVLSQQDGAVYAYFFGLYDKLDFYADGTLLGAFDGTVRLSFWKGQCYAYAAPDSSAPAVKWLNGCPAE